MGNTYYCRVAVMQFTVSGREKPVNEDIISYLRRVHSNIPLHEVESVFAFVERSTLYGGRQFVRPELVDSDIESMYDHCIGFRIPLTNLYIELEEYNLNLWLLDKYHRPGNSVIVVNDELARWVREDFPTYKVEASIIKNINTYEKIDQALEIYDTVVLPTSLNEKHNFLNEIEQKERITLFAYAGCGVNCTSKMCYPSISKFNKFNGYTDIECSRKHKPRELRGKVEFDLDEYVAMGFNRFKLIEPSGGVTIPRDNPLLCNTRI